MKAISLWQPWATLWLLSDPEEKVFETRHWYANYRGPLLVHAAKKQDSEIRSAVSEPEIMAALNRHGIEHIGQLTFGALIGKVELVDCSRMGLMSKPSEREMAFGDWQPHRYAWQRGPRPVIFDRPIPYRGAQGFFDVPASTLEASR